MTVRMFSRRRITPHRCAWPVALCVLASIAGCTGSELESDELVALRAERADLRNRFSAIQDGIRRTQAAALEDPGVRAAQDSFYALLSEQMVANDPAAEDLLARSRRIGADLDRVSGPVLTTPDQAAERVATASEREAVADELAATEQELRPHIDRAMRDPGVTGAFAALQDSVTVAMTRIDPSAAASIDRLNEIAEQMREIEIEIARLEQGR
ncbi:MAG: hypothetical protein M8865_05440 [marine benthic group bacterium]|nr:hypothetical protein [Gemmatimonadota bacterium]